VGPECGNVHVGPGCRVLFGAILWARLPPGTTVPIGLIAVGDPAQLYSRMLGQHQQDRAIDGTHENG